MSVKIKFTFILLIYSLLHFSPVLPISSNSPLQVSHVPTIIFLTPGENKTIDNIIITSNDEFQINFNSNSPYLVIVNYSFNKLSDVETQVNYILKASNIIPSGYYKYHFEVTDNKGLAYSGSVPVRVYSITDLDVSTIKIRGVDSERISRYTQLELSYKLNNHWYKLHTLEGWKYHLSLLNGKYQIKIVDFYSKLTLLDDLEISNNDLDLEYKFELLQIKIEYFESKNLLNISIQNWVGLREVDIIIETINEELIEDYTFLVKFGKNQIKLTHPPLRENFFYVIVRVDNYQQIVEIQRNPNRNSIYLLIFLGVLFILMFLSLVIVGKRGYFTIFHKELKQLLKK